MCAGVSGGARAYDQPEVKFSVKVAAAGELVECPMMVGSLGDSLETSLSNRMRLTANATPLNEEGRSAVQLKIFSPSGKLLRRFDYAAKLAQQKPSFEYTVPEMTPKTKLVVLVESPSLLATTRNHPSWREFDTRMKPNNTLERTEAQGGPRFAAAPTPCPAAQLGR